MKSSARFLLGLLISSFALTMACTIPAMAEDKGKAVKGQSALRVLLDNDKVVVLESTYEPGDVSKNVPSQGRVVRAMTSGTLQRTYPDGKTEMIEWKPGQVRYVPPAQGKNFTTRNVGKTKLVLYVVVLKQGG